MGPGEMPRFDFRRPTQRRRELHRVPAGRAPAGWRRHRGNRSGSRGLRGMDRGLGSLLRIVLLIGIEAQAQTNRTMPRETDEVDLARLSSRWRRRWAWSSTTSSASRPRSRASFWAWRWGAWGRVVGWATSLMNSDGREEHEPLSSGESTVEQTEDMMGQERDGRSMLLRLAGCGGDPGRRPRDSRTLARPSPGGELRRTKWTSGLADRRSFRESATSNGHPAQRHKDGFPRGSRVRRTPRR